MKKIVSLILIFTMLLSCAVALRVSSASYIIGDVDGDGKAQSKDMNLMKRAFAGTYTIADIRTADLNGDGSFGVVDINLFTRYLAGVYEINVPEDEKVIIDYAMYNVVVPSNATVYETYAAELLVDYVHDNYGTTMNMSDDTTAPTQYEILIGNTNREESTTNVTLGNYEYVLKLVGDKIVLLGEDFMVAGGVGDLTYDYSNENGIIVSDISQLDTASVYTPREAKNHIMMIGDGMGANQVAFTEKWMSRSANASYNYQGFIAEKMPNIGEEITYCIVPTDNSYTTYYKRTTDSAAAGTALATGYKTTFGTLGQTGFGIKHKNLVELAHENGLSTGVISTEASTGATPAAFTVHAANRANKDDILAQQEQLVENGTLTVLDCDVGDNVLTSVKTMLDTLDDNENGFFTMIEEAYIDKACHYLDELYTRNDVAYFVYRFNTAIQYALTYAVCHPDTVLLITADHETAGLTLLGNPTDPGKHTNINVPVYAIGYGTEVFNATATDNTEIAIFFAKSIGAEQFGRTDYEIDPSVFYNYSGVAINMTSSED